MKTGIICFENPFIKPSSGGKRSIMSRIKSLVLIEGMELDIYLIQMPNDRKTNIEQIYEISPRIKNVYIFNGKGKRSFLFSRFPICNNRRYVKECVNELNKHNYDFFIYEGEQVAIYRFKDAVKAKKHIIFMHDIESQYRKELSHAQTNPLLKMMQSLESHKFKYIEKRIDSFFNEVWFISSDELKMFSPMLTNNKGIYLPMPAIDIVPFYEKKGSKNILYVGDLHLKNNLLSLEWFIKNVFSIVHKNDRTIVLKVVGNIDESEKYRVLNEGVEILGYVDDIDILYKESACFVCPVIYGAGVKVKTIDALSKGIIVVTTKKGIEGTEIKSGVHLFACDSSNEMADLVVDITNNFEKYELVRRNGYLFVQQYHSIENQARIIEESLKNY